MILPNTAGCFRRRMRFAFRCLGRDLLEKNGNKGAGWVKLEVLGDKKTLLPDPVGDDRGDARIGEGRIHRAGLFAATIRGRRCASRKPGRQR